MPLRAARLILRDSSTVAAPDGTTDVLVVSTRAGDGAPYLADWPEGDGMALDPVTGDVQLGAYSVLVVDAKTGPTTRVLTALLHDTANRPHLLSRRVYLETSLDGGPWERRWAGYLTGLSLVDSITWQLELGDARRVEQSRRLWQQSSADFPIRGALFGGPIIGGWLNNAAVDRGGWEWQVIAVTGGRVYCELVAGYLAGGARQAGIDAANRELKSIIDRTDIIAPYDLATRTFPIRCVVAGFGTYQACANDPDTSTGYWLRRDTTVIRLGLVWPSSPPAIGTILRVSAYTDRVQPASALYFTEHPCDLLAKLWSQEGVQYDAGALAAVRASIGERVRLSAKITEPQPMAEWIRRAIYAPFGIAVRPDAAGRMLAFRTRLREATVPSLTIGTADSFTDDPVVFRLSEESVVTQVTLQMQQYLPWQPFNGGEAPVDGVLSSSLAYSPGPNPDAATFGTKELTFDVPAMIHTADSIAPDARDLTAAIALEVYDRWGRGCPVGDVEVPLSSAAATAQLGDEVYVSLAQLPNNSRRLGDDGSVGARIAQVVQRTERLDSVALRLLDSGTAAQPVAPAPVLALAAAASAPRAVAEFTIANAAALNATGVLGLALEWATGPSAPTGAGADLVRYAPGAIPSSPIPLHPVPAGTRVWGRARTEQVGRRSSAWTPWTSVVLTGLAAPAGLVATPMVGSSDVTLTWAPASGLNRTEVYVVQAAAPPVDWTPHRVATLAVGAVPTLTVPTLPGSLPYQWAVRHLEADGAPGALATGSFLSLALSLATAAVAGAGTANRLARWLNPTTIEDAPAVLDLSGLWPTSATLDLGTVANPWRHLQLSGTATVHGNATVGGYLELTTAGQSVFLPGTLRQGALRVNGAGLEVRDATGGFTVASWSLTTGTLVQNGDVLLTRFAGVNRTLRIDAAAGNAGRVSFERNGSLLWATGLGAWTGSDDYEVASVTWGPVFRAFANGDGRISRDWIVDRDLYVTARTYLSGITQVIGASLFVDGDSQAMVARRAGGIEVVRLGSESSWNGGTNHADGALAFRSLGRVYAQNWSVPVVTLGSAASPIALTAHGDVRILGQFRRKDDGGIIADWTNSAVNFYTASVDVFNTGATGWGAVRTGTIGIEGAVASPASRHIGGANTVDSLWSNVPAAGTHYWSENNAWVMRLRTAGAEPGLSLTISLLRAAGDFELLTFASAAQRLLTGGLLVSDSYADRSLVPTNGIYSKGVLNVDRITARSTTVDSSFPGGLTGRGGRRVPELEWDTVAPSVARPAGTFHAQVI